MPTHRSSIGAGRMNRPTRLAALFAHCVHVPGLRTGQGRRAACDTRSAAARCEIRRVVPEALRDAYVSFVRMETETRTTNIDAVGPNGWSIRDEVTQFREWGSAPG